VLCVLTFLLPHSATLYTPSSLKTEKFPCEKTAFLMQNSKFLSVLKKLKPEEIGEFGEFLQQYHKKDKTALRIFQYVQLYLPDFDHINLTANHIYEKNYKEQLPQTPPELRRKKLKKLQNKFSDLVGWLEDFLWYQKISAPSLERDLVWSTILLEREMYPELSKHRPELKKKLKGDFPGDIPGYLKQLITSYLANYRFSELVQDPDPNLLPDFIEHLDSFYAITRLKLTCEMATRKLVMPKADAGIKMAFDVDNLMALLPFDYIQSNLLVVIYKQLFALVTNKSLESYKKVEAMFKANIGRIAPEEQYAILVFLQNYAAGQIRSGDTAYLGIAHDLNVFGLKEGSFTKDGALSANHYTNIINTACNAGVLDWAWDFAELYSSRLDPAIRENVTKLGEAIILFEKEDYSGVLSTLPSESFSDTHSEIRSRSMLLRSAWELKQQKEKRILSYCRAFEQYLLNRDKKMKSDIVTASLNFVRIFKKMITGHKSKAELIAEIQSHELLYFRTWLLEKNNV